MADIYKIKWQQNQGNQGETPQLQTFKIGTDNTVKELNPLNSNWSSAGCYAGALAQNGSLMGSSSTLVFPAWNSNQYYSDLRNFQIQPSIPSGQQNLRFMAKFSTTSIVAIERQAFNWTGLTDSLVNKINEAFTNSSTSIGQLYDPYKLDLKQISMNGTSNTPLNVAPLNELKINNLIFVPYFIVKSVEYYDPVDDLSNLNAYKSVTYGNVGIYTWDQIKPEDKSTEGQNYNSDLFTKGYEADENTTHEDGLKFNYVAGCVLVPYYGKSSKIYNSILDSYTEAISPDDQKVYGERRVFGTLSSDANEYPTVYSTAQPRPNLIVLTEFASSTTGGTVYSTPAGIAFMSGTPVVGTIDGAEFGLSPNFTLDQTYQKFSASNNWSPFFFTGNADYCNFYQDYNPDSPDRPAPDLVIPATHIEITNDIVANLPDTTPTGTIFYLPNSSVPIAHTWSRNGRQTNPTTCSYFSIQELWATIASLGCYVADNVSCAQNAPTGAYVGQNNHLYLGKMDASGITDGTMLQGSDIANSTQSRIDDIIQNTPYVPVIPTPGGGGGGDDPDDPSVPKNDQGSIPYNSTLPVVGAATSFLTSYILNTAQVNAVGYNLWSKVNSNTETDARAMLSNFYRLNNSGDVNVDYGLTLAEIPDYFVSLRWFPFSLGNSVDKVSTGESAIRVGTGLTPISAGNSTTYTIQNAMCYLEGGSLNVPWTYESYLDYEPYTSASIYVPYCGTTEVQPSLIMGRTLSLHYSVSLLTGAICAIIMVQSSNGVSYPLCVMNGMVGFDIAITGNTQNAQIRNALSARDNYYLGQWNSITGGLKSVGATLGVSSLAGSMSSGMEGAGGLQSIKDFVTDVGSVGLKGAIGDAFKYNANLFNGALGAAAGLTLGSSVASAVGGPALQHQAYENSLPFVYGTQPLVVGSSSSMANLILPQTAFVQIRRKNRHDLSSDVYGNTYGYESKNSKRLGDLNGFTKCVNPKLSISGATESELNLIYGYLQTGVYL